MANKIYKYTKTLLTIQVKPFCLIMKQSQPCFPQKHGFDFLSDDLSLVQVLPLHQTYYSRRSSISRPLINLRLKN